MPFDRGSGLQPAIARAPPVQEGGVLLPHRAKKGVAVPPKSCQSHKAKTQAIMARA
jgi:hypothetical protein